MKIPLRLPSALLSHEPFQETAEEIWNRLEAKISQTLKKSTGRINVFAQLQDYESQLNIGVIEELKKPLQMTFKQDRLQRHIR